MEVPVSLRVNESFLGRRVTVILNGVPTNVEVQIDDELADGLVWVQADVALLRGRGITVSCSSSGDELKVIVTSGRSSDGVSVRSTGSVTMFEGGVANTGVMIDGRDERLQEQFSDVRVSMPVHRVMAPKVAVKLFVSSRGLLCRVVA